MTRISIERNSLVEFRGHLLLFEQELPDGVLLLTWPTTGGTFLIEKDQCPYRPTWDDLALALADGQFKLVRSTRASRFSPSSKTSGAELDLDQVRKLDPKAETRLFYVRMADQYNPGHGKKELTRFLRTVSELPEASKYTWIPSVAALKSWITNRGSPGDRRARDMISDTGRHSKPSQFHPYVERLARYCAALYWVGKFNRKDAFARLRRGVRLLNYNRSRSGLGPLSCLCKEAFRKRVNALEGKLAWELKFSKRSAKRHWQPIGQGIQADRILERVIFDASLIDDWVVLDLDVCLPLGRPWIVSAIDVHSRVILGYLVSFEPPSIYTLIECIKRCNRPKPWRIERYPKLPYGANIFGRPDQLVMDNALENVSSSIADSLLDLGISIDFAPISTPEYKNFKERFFETLNLNLIHKLSGSVPVDKNLMREMGYSPEKDACITLDELNELIEDAINLYHHERHGELRMSPAQKWQKGSQKGINILEDDSALDSMLGAVGNKAIDRSGVKLKNLTYHDPAVVGHFLESLVPDMPVRSRRRSSARAWVKFKYNPANLGIIQVYHHLEKRYYELPCTLGEYANGLTLYQHNMILAHIKKESDEFISEEDLISARNTLRAKIGALDPKLPGKIRRRIARLITPPPISVAPASMQTAVQTVISEAAGDRNGPILIQGPALMLGRTDEGARPLGPIVNGKRKGGNSKDGDASKRTRQIAVEIDVTDPEFLEKLDWPTKLGR